MTTVPQGLQSSQYNPYAEEHNPLTGAGTSYYGAQSSYSTPSQPVSRHRTMNVLVLDLRRVNLLIFSYNITSTIH